MRFKYENKKLRYVDCIGYLFAQHNGIKFLVGDRKFEAWLDVEFVK